MDHGSCCRRWYLWLGLRNLSLHAFHPQPVHGGNRVAPAFVLEAVAHADGNFSATVPATNPAESFKAFVARQFNQ